MICYSWVARVLNNCLWPKKNAYFAHSAGVFITHGDVGVGTIVGSAVFNILCIVGVCGLFAGQVSKTCMFVEFNCLYFRCLHEQIFKTYLTYLKKIKKKRTINFNKQTNNKLAWGEMSILERIYIYRANSKCFHKVQLKFHHSEHVVYRGT